MQDKRDEQLEKSIRNNPRHGVKGVMKLTRNKWLKKGRKVLPKMKHVAKNGNGLKLYTKDQTCLIEDWDVEFEKRMAEWRETQNKG